ncbi:MAG: ABC transporter substrate-binding protein [Anaerolineae bacterium]|jgi:NitT/TauT family transport system substrate-binding protein|nr:ABC transporter substrate-binding protein [Anaerolineae bacterium]
MQKRRMLWLTLALIIVVAALAGAYVLSEDGDENDESVDLTRVTLFMSYIPSVQFSPVYVAAERGYFEDEGIDIRFENGNEADGLERIATNDLQFGLISGEQVVLARANQRPVVYVFEWFHRFPVGVVSPIDQNITTPADLAGRVVGVPGTYGASYMGLHALLSAGGLTEDDLGELRSIGFAAPDSVCAGEVEAAVVYIVNEPLTIVQQCTPVNVIPVSDYATLVSNGIVTNEQTIRDNPDLVRGMVRAVRRGIADAVDDPKAAFDISVKTYVKDLPDDQYATQLQVLVNAAELWRSDQPGMTDPDAWTATQDVLIETGLLDAPLDNLAACYDMGFLPED